MHIIFIINNSVRKMRLERKSQFHQLTSQYNDEYFSVAEVINTSREKKAPC